MDLSRLAQWSKDWHVPFLSVPCSNASPQHGIHESAKRSVHATSEQILALTSASHTEHTTASNNRAFFALHRSSCILLLRQVQDRGPRKVAKGYRRLVLTTRTSDKESRHLCDSLAPFRLFAPPFRGKQKGNKIRFTLLAAVEDFLAWQCKTHLKLAISALTEARGFSGLC